VDVKILSNYLIPYAYASSILPLSIPPKAGERGTGGEVRLGDKNGIRKIIRYKRREKAFGTC
jgi:hypothetical protein